MQEHQVWDRFIRVFHILLAIGILANLTVLEDSGTAHNLIGYGIVAFVIARLGWGLIGPATARLSRLVHSPTAIREQVRDIATHTPRAHVGHSPLGGLMILNLFATVLALGVTGHLLTVENTTSASGMGSLHEALSIWLSLSILTHIAAVLWESRRIRINLPAAMITGRKRAPEGLKLRE